jgi:hypothetical protein
VFEVTDSHCPNRDDNVGLCDFLSTGLVRCMNSIIESGTLPVIYQYLPKLLEVFLFRNTPSHLIVSSFLSRFLKLPSKSDSLQVLPYSVLLTESLSASLPSSYLPLLQIFFEETYSKLSQMMSPSLSEEDSGELMLTMTKGLKMIIIIPLQYCLSYQASSLFSLFFHCSSAVSSSSSNSREEVLKNNSNVSLSKIEERLVFSQYRQLFQLFLQLEDLCYEKQYYDDQQNLNKNQLFDENNSSSIIINPFQFSEFGCLVLPVCFFREGGNDEERKEAMMQGRTIFNESWKLYQFLSRFYLIILEYSLTYHHHQSSKLIYQANHSSSSCAIESKVSNQCYLFLFTMVTSLLLSTSLSISRFFTLSDSVPHDDLQSEFSQLIFQYKEYWNFLQGIIKQLMKSSPLFMKSVCSLPIKISSGVIFQSYSSLFLGLLKYVLLKVLYSFDNDVDPKDPTDKSRSNLVLFSRFLFEKMLFVISFIKQEGLVNDGNLVPYNQKIFCKCCFRSFAITKKLIEHLFESKTAEEEEDRMHVIHEDKIMDINYEENPSYGRLFEYFNQYFALDEKRGLDAVTTTELDGNTKKRKFITVSDNSALQTVIENASKKQIRQGIIPIMYNSAVDRVNHDQQSQDNHIFSLNSQFYNSQQGNNNNNLAMKLFNSQKSQSNNENSQKSEEPHVPVSAFSSAKQLLQQSVAVLDPLPPVPVFTEQIVNNIHEKKAEEKPQNIEISGELNPESVTNDANSALDSTVMIVDSVHPKTGPSDYDQILLVLKEMQADCEFVISPKATHDIAASRSNTFSSSSASPSLNILNDMFQKSQKLQSLIVSLILQNQEGNLPKAIPEQEKVDE